MKSILLIAAIAVFSNTSTNAQTNNLKTEAVRVLGNCGMCETAIENAAKVKKISKADWNETSKMATITYDSNKTNLDAVLKNIALAGYDNEKYLAPDAAYNKLPDCCRYKREMKQVAVKIQHGGQTSDPAPKSDVHQHNHIENTNQEKNNLNSVFESYFLLKDELVKSDGNTASLIAKELQTAISAVKVDGLPKELKTAWDKVSNGLKEDVKKIGDTKDIAKQRDHFMSLSKNMYDVVKAAKITEKVYYQFCPMADGGKGANWLSKENAIKNPYYGSQMLTCGKTVETITQ